MLRAYSFLYRDVPQSGQKLAFHLYPDSSEIQAVLLVQRNLVRGLTLGVMKGYACTDSKGGVCRRAILIITLVNA